MSVLPEKILVATDGSERAARARDPRGGAACRLPSGDARIYRSLREYRAEREEAPTQWCTTRTARCSSCARKRG